MLTIILAIEASISENVTITSRANLPSSAYGYVIFFSYILPHQYQSRPCKCLEAKFWGKRIKRISYLF